MQFTCPRCECLYASDQADGLCPRCLANMAVHPTGRREPGSPLEVGRTFHGMLVQALIATGGMGVVYRARKPGSDADVALKILPPSLGLEAEFRERFDREARALAGLAHPNIVRLHDFGIADDLMFLVMEFVEGRSLRQLLRDGKVTPARALTIIRELCAALEYAHHERVIHRDVKPDNILLDSSGRVKLSDFGLAKRIDPEASRLTQTNFAVGTPHYMAPEQLENPIAIDHRVDIYSTGVVLYEMLTRELPIGRFPLPSTKAAIDPALDTIICRCLEKDPDLRYASVRELRGALSSVAGAAPEQAEATTPPRPKISSNLEVACPCGWSFFVPAGRRGNVHCPSCGDRISVTQPT
ncbi:MAG TPA: serine/threonine-protein kinase, partial [Planctomycetota bacterium]|nr:serine/threonine-protein kinase [Planctomycetota bacterium]